MSSSFRRPGKKTMVRQRPPSGSGAESSSASPVPATSVDSVTNSVSDLSIQQQDRSRPQQSLAVQSKSKKKTSSPAYQRQLPGTKPWTNNLTLTSFGLREIDSFLFSSSAGGSSSSGGGGGGQPLQTFVILEEDRLTDDLARQLCRYWCAEGVAQGQVVVLGATVPSIEESLEMSMGGGLMKTYSNGGFNYEGSASEELKDFVMSLPRNLHLDKFRSKMNAKSVASSSSSTIKEEGRAASSAPQSASFAIIEEENESDDEEDGKDNSKGNSLKNDDLDGVDNLENDIDNSNSNSNEDGLINAWQYRKSIQDARSGVGGSASIGSFGSEGGGGVGDGIYCHSYDLSKCMWDQFVSNDGDEKEVLSNNDGNPLLTHTKIVDCWEALCSSNAVDYRKQGMDLFRCLWKHIQTTFDLYSENQYDHEEEKHEKSIQRSNTPSTVIRLFLQRLPVGPGSVAMPLLMAKIRKDNLPVVVLATIRPWRWLSSNATNRCNNKLDTLASLRNTADTTLSLDSFPSLRTPPPPEFQLLQGILTVRKCASFTVAHYTDTVTWKRPLAERFGVKRDGRKVTVQLLHLPPEEYSRAGGSVGSGVRSGGGNVNHGESKGSDGGKKSKSHGGCGGGSLDF